MDEKQFILSISKDLMAKLLDKPTNLSLENPGEPYVDAVGERFGQLAKKVSETLEEL